MLSKIARFFEGPNARALRMRAEALEVAIPYKYWPSSDWEIEVQLGNTDLDYESWVQAKAEAASRAVA